MEYFKVRAKKYVIFWVTWSLLVEFFNHWGLELFFNIFIASTKNKTFMPTDYAAHIMMGVIT